MKISKPNWNPLELDANYKRWERLIHETESHDAKCDCNLCMEEFALSEFMDLFTDDEFAESVKVINELHYSQSPDCPCGLCKRKSP